MTHENRRANVRLEVERAAASLRAAELCLASGLYDDAVSRAYYAAYHMVRAVLLTQGHEPRSHGGVHDLLFLHFVHTGLLPGRLAKLFAALQRFREQADYARVFRFAADDAGDEVASAREICSSLRAWLEQEGWMAGA